MFLQTYLLLIMSIMTLCYKTSVNTYYLTQFLWGRNLADAELSGSGSKSLMRLQLRCHLGCRHLKALLGLEGLLLEKAHSHGLWLKASVLF